MISYKALIVAAVAASSLATPLFAQDADFQMPEQCAMAAPAGEMPATGEMPAGDAPVAGMPAGDMPMGGMPQGSAHHGNNAGTHQFSGDDWRLKLISFLDNFRCIRSRIIYGDQALFVRRTLFDQLGGFPNRPILEDVAFCERLIAVTTPLLLSPSVVTDARKFLKMGVWRSFLRVLLIILHVEFHLPVLPRAFFQDVR